MDTLCRQLKACKTHCAFGNPTLNPLIYKNDSVYIDNTVLSLPCCEMLAQRFSTPDVFSNSCKKLHSISASSFHLCTLVNGWCKFGCHCNHVYMHVCFDVMFVIFICKTDVWHLSSLTNMDQLSGISKLETVKLAVG